LLKLTLQLIVTSTWYVTVDMCK